MNNFLKNILSSAWEGLKILILAMAIVLPVRYFIFQPFFVRGASMEPNFYNGDYLIVDEISYRFSEPERGDVIVFKYPENPSQKFIKRIVGLPGETLSIKQGQVFVFSPEGEVQLDEAEYLIRSETPGAIETVLGENEYFVLGDNRFYSSDSRRWGVLPAKNIIGRVYFRTWPFAALAKVESPNY